MKNIKYYLVFTFLAAHFFVLAQHKQLKGVVKDARTNEELIDAFVYIEGTSIATYSRLDGSFTINVPVSLLNPVLVVSFVSHEKFIKKISKEDFSQKMIVLMNPVMLDQIVILKNKDSIDQGMSREKNADFVENVMSSKAIQLSPDITVANNLQRMSGVNVDRNASGEGRYVIIRGMDKRYNYTTVNGIKVPSPDNKNRYIPMDIFPSELVERIEVIKALTPNMEGDAIGGAMNVVMKDAPNKFLFNANMAGGFSQFAIDSGYKNYDRSLANPKDPAQLHGNPTNPAYSASPSDFPMAIFNSNKITPVNSLFGMTIGNRFLKGKKLGVILSGTVQNNFKTTSSLYFVPSAQPDGTQGTATSNFPVFDDVQLRRYDIQTRRIGVNAKVDYEFNARNKITLSGIYLSMLEQEQRTMVDSVLSIQRTGPGSGSVDMKYRSKLTQQNIYNAILSGEHYLTEDFKINWTGAYCLATSLVPDWADITVNHAVSWDSTKTHQVFTPQVVTSMSRIWTENTDQDITGKLDASYHHKFFGVDVDLSGGGFFRHKSRNNYYNEYDLSPTGSPQLFTNFNDAKFYFTSGAQIGSYISNANSYSAQEDVTSGYGMMKIKMFDRLQLLGGVRVENTWQGYNTTMPNTFAGASGTHAYMDLLPSGHLKYEITKKQNLRASYFSSIARPAFYEIIPFQINGDYYNEAGNPNLKHSTADNYDLRYEFFPTSNDQILIGVFDKHIYNPIEWAFVRPQGKPSAYNYEPGNFGTAVNVGAEFVVAKYIKNFGISANYTYTNSSITTPKVVYYRDSGGQLVQSTLNQTRPLQGQAANIGNLSLHYKNKKAGINAQVALVYTGQRIVQLSQYYNMDYWQDPFYTLDFSAEKTFFKKFIVYAKLNNITNTPYNVYMLHSNPFLTGNTRLGEQTDANKILVRRDYYGQNYLIGLRYKF